MGSSPHPRFILSGTIIGVPSIDPARHSLLIHGLVARPLIFTVDELERFPAVSRLAFVECSGNTWDGWWGGQRYDGPGYLWLDEHQ